MYSKTFQNIVKSIRLKQITKNFLLFAGIVFSGRAFILSDVIKVVTGFLLFTVLTWSVYLFNDIQNRQQDKRHPEKCHRPIASGTLSVGSAYLFSGVFAIFSLTLSFYVSPYFGYCCGTYFGMNILYSLLLQNVVILDVMTIASGFFIRIISGALLINVEISHWLVVCGIFLSLFLGFAKRRSELTTNGDYSRPILSQYSKEFTDQLITVLTAGTIISYILYTKSPTTIAKFHTDHLIYTVPFVLYGIMRFLWLIYFKEKGQNPAEDIISDLPMIIASLGWAITVFLVLYS